MSSHSKDEDGSVNLEEKNTKANHTSELKKNNDILHRHKYPLPRPLDGTNPNTE